MLPSQQTADPTELNDPKNKSALSGSNKPNLHKILKEKISKKVELNFRQAKTTVNGTKVDDKVHREIQKIWDIYDTDKNGTLDREELKEYIQKTLFKDLKMSQK